MRKLLYTILICASGVGIATPVFALTVSPARVEITGDPGTTLQGEISLFNEQEGARTFFTSFENFEPSGDTGAPHFIGRKNGLATWIQAESKVMLASGQRAVVPFLITIPQNAEPGGYFAAVFFGSQEPEATGGGQVSVGGKIGVLILLRVSGEVEEGGGLLAFTTKEKQKFFSTLPVAFAYRINNTGGDRTVPHGEVTIKNTLQITSAKLLANDKEGSVLPNSTRKFEVIWGEVSQPANTTEQNTEYPGFFEMAGKQWSDFHFGWYTANLNLVWGDDASQTANAAYHFFIIPWQLLIIVLLIVLFFGFVGRIGLKKYNRYIIVQATRNKQ
ncbi:MAG: hypothetical protein AAB508_02105 [Patescibacteria group bacterium]